MTGISNGSGISVGNGLMPTAGSSVGHGMSFDGFQPSFTPLSLFATGNQAYYKAGSGGNTTSQWNDISGNAFHATQTVAGNRFTGLTTRRGGQTCYSEEISVLGGFNLPSGLSIDKRNHSWFAIFRTRSTTAGDDRTLCWFGAGLIDCLYDLGASSGAMVLRRFNTLTDLQFRSDPCIVICTADASGVTMRINGVEDTISANSAGTLTGGGIFYREDDAYSIAGEAYEYGVLDRIITAGEIASLEAYAQSIMSRNWPTYGKLVISGDSLTEGQVATTSLGWPALLDDSIGHNWRQISRGQGGLSATSESTAMFAVLYDAAFTKNVYVDFLGINDLRGGATAAALLTTRRALWSAARTAGFKVIACTITKSGDASGIACDAARVTHNSSLAGEVSGNIDAVADVAGLAHLSDPNDTTYFQTDKLHFQDVIFAEIQAVVETAVLSV